MILSECLVVLFKDLVILVLGSKHKNACICVSVRRPPCRLLYNMASWLGSRRPRTLFPATWWPPHYLVEPFGLDSFSIAAW